MKFTEKEIIDYFKEIYDYPEIFLENSDSSLTFSYLLGMDPRECINMYPETEWTTDEIDEYDEINGIIYKIQKNLRTRGK